MKTALTIQQMRDYVQQSRGHIAKQHAIIARLDAQGHVGSAEQARELLPAMLEHLKTELTMLARMEAGDADPQT